MKRLSDSYFQKSLQWLIYLLTVSMVIFSQFAPTVIVLILAVWVFQGQFVRKLVGIRQHFFFTSLFIVMFVLYLSGLLYTTNFSYGLTDVFLKIPFILFPLVFSGFGQDLMGEGHRKKVMMIFSCSVILIALYSLGQSTLMYFEIKDVKVFYYGFLAGNQHPSYLAMYSVFAIAVLLVNAFENSSELKILHWVFIIFGVMFLFVFVILLSSRAGMISLIMTFVVAAVFILTEQRQYAKGSLFLLSFIIFFYVCYEFFPRSFGRLQHTGEVLAGPVTDNTTEDGTAQRLLIWDASISIIKENLLLGVGTGDVKDELMLEYKKRGMDATLKSRKNAHNQYLQTFVTIGIAGFVSLLLMFLIPGLYAIRSRDLLYFLFLAIVGMNLLFESMFERQAGVVFYTFFNAYLFFSRRGNDE
ncbi:MAG: O-antigen ligase family protein [Bacteroidales bacterium]|nr:O-antigen ligase family protein [Bacteroidales bacterium]